MTLAVTFLWLFLDGCAGRGPEAPTATGRSSPAITMPGTQQERVAPGKVPVPTAKPTAAPAPPTPSVQKPSVASPKAAEQAATVAATPAAIRGVQFNAGASEGTASEPARIQGADSLASAPQSVLVFKGPPRGTTPMRRFGQRTLVWLGVSVYVVVAAVGVTVVLRHRSPKGSPKVESSRQTSPARLALQGAPKEPEAAPGE